jgi:hypothetical protein
MSNKLYCGIEDEVFFLKDGPLDRMFSRKKRTIPLGEIIQKEQSKIITPKGGVDSFWNQYGGLVYAESGATEVTTPLIEQGEGCVLDLVNSSLVQRAVLIQMKEDYEINRSCKIRGYSSHYNITIDSDLENFDLNSIKKHPLEGTVDDFWPKFTTDIIETMIKTIGPAYFLLFEDDVSGGFMYRVRKQNRFELCGDFMPDYAQLSSGLAFLLGSLKGIENIIKNKILENSNEKDILKTYKDLTPKKILAEFPIVLDDISFRRIKSKKGLGSGINFIKKMKRKGSRAKLKINGGSKITSREILKEYLNQFSKEISYYAGGGEVEFLNLIANNRTSPQIDVPGKIKFYDDICETYMLSQVAKTDEQVLADLTPKKGMGKIVSDFVKNKKITFKDVTLSAIEFNWKNLVFEMYETNKNKRQKIVVGVDNANEFYQALKKGNVAKALSFHE